MRRACNFHTAQGVDRLTMKETAADAVVVRGNKRHFPVKARRGVKVLAPAEFIELLRRRP